MVVVALCRCSETFASPSSKQQERFAKIGKTE